MTKELWTKNFIFLLGANALMFGGFHMLLPTLPVYAAANGGTGTQLGIIAGIFGFSAIFIRFFIDLLVNKFGKKKCLYIGLFISFLCTIGYALFPVINNIILIRIFHGFGFGITSTFYAAIAADIIPSTRLGEGMGYFGLGSTVMMAIVPAVGVWMMDSLGFIPVFIASSIGTGIALIGTMFCYEPQNVIEEKEEHKKNCNSIFYKLIERGTVFPACLTMLFGVGYGSANTFVAMLAQEASIGNSGYFFLVGTICVFLSRPFAGKLFDRKGPTWVVLPGGLFLFAGLAILTQTTSLIIFLSASVLYGFGAGFLLPSLLSWMLNIVNPDRRSATSATFYNMLDVGTSGGAILLGMIAETTGYISMYKYSTAALGIFILAYIVYLCIYSNTDHPDFEVDLAPVPKEH